MSTKKVENIYTPNCIRTYTGIYINVFDPKPEMIDIEDIAHALASEPRWGGHLPYVYSVAQHSVMCMRNMPHNSSRKRLLQALMHDGSEAYLRDISSPIKAGLANYKDIEHRLMVVIADKFKFNYPLCYAAKDVDSQRLHWEWYNIALVRPKFLAWFKCWGRRKAKRIFLKEFRRLTQ